MRGKDGERKKRERKKKKEKFNVVAFLHSLESGARFIENRNWKKRKS